MSDMAPTTFDVNQGRTEIVVNRMQTVHAKHLDLDPDTVVTLTIHDPANHIEWVLELVKDDAEGLGAAILQEAKKI